MGRCLGLKGSVVKLEGFRVQGFGFRFKGSGVLGYRRPPPVLRR